MSLAVLVGGSVRSWGRTSEAWMAGGRRMPAALVWLCFAKPALAGRDRAGRAGGQASSGPVVRRLRAAPCARLLQCAGRGLPTVTPAMSWWGDMRDCHAIAEAIGSHVHDITSHSREHQIGSRACPAGRRHSRWLPKISSWHLKADARPRGFALRCRDAMQRCNGECVHPVGQTDALQSSRAGSIGAL